MDEATPEEITNCRDWLETTFDEVPGRVLLALGQIGFRAILGEARNRGWYQGKLPKFSHRAKVELSEGRTLLASYHPSQQNTFTGRLTEEMFDAVFTDARELLQR